ncbi:MAG TPA: mevalonate kinase [Anaerolineae bacterium]|nr:mevalonate kinase [Anaerolineae bacterium]
MTVGSACGKIILFGEHAVVYGRPALAVPLVQLRARARVKPRGEGGIVIQARNLGRTMRLLDGEVDEALAAITRLTLQKLGVSGDVNLEIEIESDIPIASGLGSGAAISTAIVRALTAYFGKLLTADEISALVYETEKIYHGTPSGIDNTVIAYEQPIRFVRRGAGSENEITPFRIARPFTLVIANTGIASSTKITVGDVRREWERDPARYEKMFDMVGEIVQEAQDALARGENEALGKLMTRNQRVLEAMGVSSLEIERLIEAGIRAGAKGGKLSGGGRGGNVIFYVTEERAEGVRMKLLDAGAAGVIVTEIRPNNNASTGERPD